MNEPEAESYKPTSDNIMDVVSVKPCTTSQKTICKRKKRDFNGNIETSNTIADILSNLE